MGVRGQEEESVYEFFVRMRWAVLGFETGGGSELDVVICTSKRRWIGFRAGWKAPFDILVDTKFLHFVLRETGGSTNPVGYLSSYVFHCRG